MTYDRWLLFALSMIYAICFPALLYADAMQKMDTTSGYRLYIEPIAIVQGDAIYIRDIARIEKDFPSDVLKHIEHIPLWEAPKTIGTSITFSEVRLRKRIQELLGKNAVFCKYPTMMTVQRGGRIFYRKDIEKDIRTMVRTALEKEYTATVNIQGIRMPEYILARDSKSIVRIDIKKLSLAKTILTLTVIDAMGNVEQRIPLSATTHVYVKAWCATQYIERHAYISPYLKECMHNASLLSNTLLFSSSHGVYRAKRAIAEGDVLLESDVELIPDIRKGKTIELVYDKNGIRLSTKAQALMDAYIGENIKVQAPYSKKYIYATVIDEDTVRIP